MPEAAKTLGHPQAIEFTQSILEQRWADAETLFADSVLVDQAHLISVASDVGGSPDSCNEWINLGTQSGVAELLRGATAIVSAWEVRSSASAESVDAEVLDEFHRLLEAAEADLHAAAELMPGNSIPWKHLLTSGRGLHASRTEMDNRYVRHIELGELLAGHMSFQQFISRKWAGSHEEMWEHAEWINQTSTPGSPNPALVAIALIEHHIKPDVHHDNIRQLPEMIGRSQIVGEAAFKSYADEGFDASTPEGAMALSAWFTLHYLMGNWDHAAGLMPRIGDRFTRFPMTYFHDSSWSEIQQYVSARVARAA